MSKGVVLSQYPYEFCGFHWDGEKKKIVIGWKAETSAANLARIAMLTFGFCWPPIRFINKLLDRDKKD